MSAKTKRGRDNWNVERQQRGVRLIYTQNELGYGIDL